VAEPSGDGHNVHAALQVHRGKGRPKFVEIEMFAAWGDGADFAFGILAVPAIQPRAQRDGFAILQKLV
jgi:hypothetical protein